LEEWLDADTSLQIVGRACISMLSESLKMYLQTWERLFGVECQRALPAFFKKGFWPGYKECFGQLVPLDWSACPADLSVIEQIVVARNTSQHHTGDIGTLTIRHPPNLREKFERPIFIHEHEKGWSEEDRVDLAWFGSELVITKETLDEAVGQAEFLVEWLEPQLQERR
jgi:hypothetical protein